MSSGYEANEGLISGGFAVSPTVAAGRGGMSSAVAYSTLNNVIPYANFRNSTMTMCFTYNHSNKYYHKGQDLGMVGTTAASFLASRKRI